MMPPFNKVSLILIRPLASANETSKMIVDISDVIGNRIEYTRQFFFGLQARKKILLKNISLVMGRIH